jgi:Protein of unknown function (DUF1553)/Protein of unknown function (DUF1549)
MLYRLRFAFVHLVCWSCLLGTASAADLKILPHDITLTGPHASQRLLIAAEEGGAVTGDQTVQATFTSANPAVAVVDAGTVRPVGDGETTITATVDGKQANAKVKVVRAKETIDWSFRNHVIPMMTRIGCNSGACHGALAGKGGLKLSLRGYNPEADHFVMTRQTLGRRVNKIEPNKSLVLLKPSLAIPHGGGQKLEVGSPDYRLLADWIAAGASGIRADDPAIQRLEVLPAAAVLKPKDTLQVLVRAWYSDGHSEDVTHWAKFNSSEDLVATVDAEGKATVAGYGETAITVWYSNLVAANRIASPLPNSVDAKVFASAPRNSFIDDLVLRKLASLHIPPSSACDDAEFIRRAYLDAAGILPTPDEAKKFLADPSPDKRAKLIDALLERPEYVDYWAHKWSDLLLISTRRLPQPAVWAFYQDVRKSVADDKPWDRFARDLLTTSGSTLDAGAANYFVIHKDVSDLTEATAVTFMGMSITCCRCHNHPLEKWTQDQYWEFANLFSRVGLKNGDRAGEVLVQSLPSGEALHLRRGVAMPPTPLDGKPLALDSPIDRRQYFADWLTAPDNAYFARSLVNRVWRNFMGRGLVEPEDDLRQTNPPTNPELLDALAKDFVDSKYDVKVLIRRIMNSAAYQRSSKAIAGNESDDRFYSHYLLRRLPAEVLLDAYSQVTDAPTPFTQLASAAGDSMTAYTGYPLGTRATQLPDSLVVSRFLEAFGRPERVATCSCERQDDSSVGQALHVNNGKTLNDKLRDPKGRVEAWIKEKVSDDQAVRRLYLSALSREPGPAEAKKFHDLLADAAADGKTTRREALEDLFWAVLASKEFVFNH